MLLGVRKEKLEGMRFERLKVLEYVGGSRYRCKCDCGNEKVIVGADMKKGKTKSCGCLSKEHELDLVGKKFNNLTVIERCGKTKKNRYLFKCICECGNEKITEGRWIKSGKIKSCGCGMVKGIKEANTTHGMTGTRIYYIWSSMKGRCFNKSEKAYPRYGGRGITVCDEWLEDFINFYNWAMGNGYEEYLTIDRINNDGNYEPSNCRWATQKEQNDNRNVTLTYTYNNETKPLSDWCKEFGLLYDSVWKRIHKYNYSFEKAITYRTDRVRA